MKPSIRNTRLRNAIATIIQKSKHGISAQGIIDANKKLDKVTVYRTVKAFEEAGLIRRVELRKRAAVYEWVENEHHHHIVCTECGFIEHVENEKVEKVLTSVESPKFAQITDHSCEWYGICKGCAR